MLALLAPGQGSQTPGFLAPWLENPAAKELLAHWSSVIDLDLLHLGTTADGDEIRNTENAQPLLVAGGILGTLALLESGPLPISYLAGHSVGEITAAALAGVMDSDTAMSLVRARGVEMANAALGTETGMSAVLGGERESVLASITSLGLTAANENGAGQIVAAGPLVKLAALAENPPEGSRVRALAVSGAFHTSTMAPALEAMSALAASAQLGDPTIPLLSNKDGQVITDGGEVLDRIIGQIAGPVRWDLCMERLAALGVTGVLEVPPAGTLVGLVKRATPGIETFALKSPEDLPAAREFMNKHGGK